MVNKNINQKKIERIPIQEGIQLDTIIEVFGNLKKSDLIIEKPNKQMRVRLPSS